MLLVALQATCRSDPSPTAASSASAVPTAAANAVVVRLDGKTVERLESADLVERRLLHRIVGRETSSWQRLSATSRDGRALRLDDFGRAYPEHEVRLFRDERGRLALGVFRLASPSMPARVKAKLASPHLVFVAPVTVDVHTVAADTPEAPTRRSLEVTRGEERRTLAPGELEALEPRPGRGRMRGWSLADALALHRRVAPHGILAYGASGDPLWVSPTQLAEHQARLRYNQRGMLKLTLFDADEASTKTVRDLRRVDVLAAPR
jgi:hypothetical protein